MATISAYEKELKERDIVIFLSHNGKRYDTDLKRTGSETERYIPKDFSGYLLIGKDGGIKSKRPYPIHPEEIFTLIDGMPVRKAEMNSNH